MRDPIYFPRTRLPGIQSGVFEQTEIGVAPHGPEPVTVMFADVTFPARKHPTRGHSTGVDTGRRMMRMM